MKVEISLGPWDLGHSDMMPSVMSLRNTALGRVRPVPARLNKILAYMMLNPGRCIPYDELIANCMFNSRSPYPVLVLQAYISDLRKLLRQFTHKGWIRTFDSRGYGFGLEYDPDQPLPGKYENPRLAAGG